MAGCIGLFELMGGCSWTPQIETELHNSSKGIVSLRTIDDKSLGTDHPVEMTEGTMERVLQGAHKFRDPRLIEALITNDEHPLHLFSQKQIAFLAPLLTSALAQATPEEEVFFQCTSEFEGAPPIKGSMLVFNSTLFFTWEEPLSKPHVLAKQHRETNSLMDPSMPQGHMLTFFPHEGIRLPDDSTRLYLKRLGENTIAIDYPVLAGLPKTVFEIPELREEGESTVKERRPKGEGEPRAKAEAPEKPTTTGTSQSGNAEVLSETTSDPNADIRALRKQMEKLQQEVDKQQEELDRLKKDKP